MSSNACRTPLLTAVPPAEPCLRYNTWQDGSSSQTRLGSEIAIQVRNPHRIHAPIDSLISLSCGNQSVAGCCSLTPSHRAVPICRCAGDSITYRNGADVEKAEPRLPENGPLPAHVDMLIPVEKYVCHVFPFHVRVWVDSLFEAAFQIQGTTPKERITA